MLNTLFDQVGLMSVGHARLSLTFSSFFLAVNSGAMP